MLIHLLISLSYSRRFCLCQPDGLVDSCSLKKKCHRYFSQSDIIIYNPQTNLDKNLISNFSFSENAVSSNFGQLLFEVFGSQKGNKKNSPIYINMLDNMFSNITKLTLYGGELNQVVHILNMSSKNISFEAQNIQVIFDNENQINFNTLSIRNSLLKSKNTSINNQKSKLTIKAQEIIGDSVSLSSDHYSLIQTGKLQLTDKKEEDYNITNNFGITTPVEIIDFTQTETVHKNTKNKKILEDDSLTVVDRFAYCYCLATQARLSRVKELQECDAYSVPTRNYYSSRDTEFLSKIAQIPENETLKLYVTLSTQADPLRINFPPFSNKNVIISIISADVDTETRVEVKGRTTSLPIEESNLTLDVSKVNYFLCDSNYLESFNNVNLYQSPIYIGDSEGITDIRNLITDGVSLSKFTDTSIRVNFSLELSKAIPVTLASKVFLEANCTVNVNQYSAFPITRYSFDNVSQTYYLTLSDSIEDQKLNLYFNDTLYLNYIEGASVVNPPSLTFGSGKEIDTDRIKNCPYLHFNINVPVSGIIVNYGSHIEWEKPFPHKSIFIFTAPPNDQEADFNLTINDFEKVQGGILEMYVLTLIGHFNLNVMTSETIKPYLLGINTKYDNTADTPSSCDVLYGCTVDTLPYFVEKETCYQIGGYNLTLVNLDVQDNFNSIIYNKTAVHVGMSDSNEKFPKIAKAIEITTSTNGEVNFSIVTERTQPDNMTELKINFNGSPKLIFDKTYEEASKDIEAMQKLTVNHGLNDILLIGDTIPVPPIKIEDPIRGVLFESNGTEFPIKVVSDTTFTDNNTRYGPEINVEISSDVNYPQEAFLAENVTFSGNSQRLHFNYKTESRSKYTFNGLIVDFVNEDKKVDFKGKYIKLENSQIIQTDPLTINVDELHINSVLSIPSISVSAPVIVNENLNILLDTNSNSKLLQGEGIKQIIFGEDSVTLVNQDNKRSAKLETSDPNAQTNISTNQEQEIQLSVEDGADSVPYNVNIDFNGNKANLNYDKSWSNVEIPDSFVTNFNNMNADDVHLSTEMMHLPNVTIKGVDEKSIQTSTHKQKLTKNLAFWIFVGITALVFVITLILCIVGLTCCKYVEELDVSSSAEGDSDFAIGEIDGLPRTQAEELERRNALGKIKEDRDKAIEDRKRKREERKKKIAEGKLAEEEDFVEEEDYELEDAYPFDEDDLYHNRSQVAMQPKPQKEKKKPANKKKNSETSEEFKLAKKKAQLETASGGAPPPAAPPPANTKKAESNDDAESASYNQSGELSDVSLSNSDAN